MRPPKAVPTTSEPRLEAQAPRAPRAFAPDQAEAATENVTTLSDATPAEADIAPPPRPNWLLRLFLGALGLLVTTALALWAEALVRDLFAHYAWMGWAALALVAILALTLIFLLLRELLALRRLGNLDRLRADAMALRAAPSQPQADSILARLDGVYRARPDLARARQTFSDNQDSAFDPADKLMLAERSLLAPLDARARALTAASARRVAIVTAISPRALVDLAFVAYESVRLASRVAALYGARPGFFGALRLARAVLAHLAVTGGVALGDSVIQQLLGHGLAAKVSARLGEGLVNGLMTVRIGIAAARVVRPLPYAALKQPVVADFLPELIKVTTSEPSKAN